MDLLTLAAKITLDDKSYVNGLREAEGLGSQFANKMSATTVALGNLIAQVAMKAAGALKDMFSSALDGYSDYEQLIGGVETLFKSSSDKVSAYARQAFKTAGLSANEYMETVTGFSASLLQGLQGDTEAAAELANLAIMDMADNANKMGTDLSSIQNAYQGFAKQNYTMLDNLKLGYGGTASEMLRLVNDSGILDHEISSLDEITFDQLILAIHEVQTALGITGTTEEEASGTIAGSFRAMKAAWDDLLTSIGGQQGQERMNEAIENFKTAFSTYVSNIAPVIAGIIGNSGSLVGAIIDAITDLPNTALSDSFETLTEGATSIVQKLSELTSWVIEGMANLFRTAAIDKEGVAKLGEAIGEFLGSAIKDIVTYAPQLIFDIIDVGATVAVNFVKGLWEGLFGSEYGRQIDQINDEFQEKILDVEVSSSRADAILNYMEKLYREYGDAVTETGRWRIAQEELEKVLEGSSSVFAEYGDDIDGAIGKLREMTEQLRILAIQQAMQDKLTSQLARLGEWEEQRYSNQIAIEMARENEEAINQKRIASAKAYAQEMLAFWNANGYNDETIQQADWETQKRYNELRYYARGEVYDASTDTSTRYEELSAEEMQAVAENLASDLIDAYADRGVADEDKIWNLSEFDYIVDPDTVKGLTIEYNLQEQAIENSTKKIKEAEDAIAELNKEIEITTRAIARASEDLETSISNAASGIEANGSYIARAIGAGFERSGGTYAPKAIGMDFVPEDGFRAELHRGEAVLTKAEADAWRSGVDYDQVGFIIGSAVEDAMSKMYLNMNGEKVADMTTKRVGANISANTYARVRAMGG